MRLDPRRQKVTPTMYTDAPATALVATVCAICNRELVDAVSVETGIGPTCRKRHSHGEAQGAPSWGDVERVALALSARLPEAAPVALPVERTPEAAHRLANVLVHRIAADPHAEAVPHLLAAVSALGYVTLADAIAANLVPLTVRVEPVSDRVLAVSFDRAEARGETFERLVAALRSVPGRWWDAATSRNLIPTKQRAALWGALKGALPSGTIVRGARIAVL